MRHASRLPLQLILEELFSENTTRDDLEHGLTDLLAHACPLSTKEPEHVRVRRLTKFLCDCRKALERSPVLGMRYTATFVLISGLHQRRAWLEIVPQIWSEAHRSCLAGSYQFSLGIAQAALTLTEHERAHAREAGQQTLLRIARLALQHAVHGFVLAGPRVHGVRLDPRFAQRTRRLLFALYRLSSERSDHQLAFHFKHLASNLLGEAAKRQQVSTIPRPLFRDTVASHATPWTIGPLSRVSNTN